MPADGTPPAVHAARVMTLVRCFAHLDLLDTAEDLAPDADAIAEIRNAREAKWREVKLLGELCPGQGLAAHLIATLP